MRSAQQSQKLEESEKSMPEHSQSQESQSRKKINPLMQSLRDLYCEQNEERYYPEYLEDQFSHAENRVAVFRELL